MIGSQLSSQIAETVAEVKESSSEAQPEPQADAASGTEEETSEISNIVDSVLADLKPKLMAEIAKKMGKEKKSKSCLNSIVDSPHLISLLLRALPDGSQFTYTHSWCRIFLKKISRFRPKSRKQRVGFFCLLDLWFLR